MLKRLIKFFVFIFTILYLINPTQAADLENIAKETMKIAEPYYLNGRYVALKYPELHNYSDHGVHHAELVAIKSQSAAKAINKAIKDNPKNKYYAEIDEVELQVAAIMHDTGMDGGSFKNYENGNLVRKDHSLNSAIHVLENREKIAEFGVDVDAVAVDCMAHSKSCSGVRDLTSVEQWLKCFNRIDDAVKMYNEKYPDKKIYFDRRRWIDNGKINADYFAKTASIVAALRLGDANREAAEYPFNQSGSYIEVNFDSYVPNAETWQEEVKNADITLIDIYGNVNSIQNISTDSEGYDKMYPTGEGNLSMDCVYNPKTQSIKEQFKIHHAMSFPLATQQCIEERLEELDTIKNFPVEAEIKIDGSSLSSADKRKLMRKYRRYCKTAQKQHGFPVKYVVKS